MGKAISRAKRCFCRRDENAKNGVREMMKQIEVEMEEQKGVV